MQNKLKNINDIKRDILVWFPKPGHIQYTGKSEKLNKSGYL